MLGKLARCGTHKRDSHVCRNLHRFLHRSGKSLNVAIATVNTRVRASRKRPAQVPVAYPVLKPSNWIRCSFALGGHAVLFGNTLDATDLISKTLHEFWSRYQQQDPEFPYFRESSESEWSHAIPIALHGDEGRGKGKKPVMVIAVQTLLSSVGKPTWKGASEARAFFHLQ